MISAARLAGAREQVLSYRARSGPSHRSSSQGIRRASQAASAAAIPTRRVDDDRAIRPASSDRPCVRSAPSPGRLGRHRCACEARRGPCSDGRRVLLIGTPYGHREYMTCTRGKAAADDERRSEAAVGPSPQAGPARPQLQLWFRCVAERARLPRCTSPSAGRRPRSCSPRCAEAHRRSTPRRWCCERTPHLGEALRSARQIP
jgi:hypothetical protein